MIAASWSRCGDAECVRLTGLPPEADAQIRPGTPDGVEGRPPMAGRLVRDGEDLCFVPRFAFVDGTTYTASVGGVTAAVLIRPRPERAPTTEVVAVFPSAGEVPRNLLRLYVWFSAPMSEGYAAQRVRLVDEAGEALVGALLPTEHELWDAERRRLTVLLDPARIKRGLVAHLQVGYPLQSGTSFRLVVDDGFDDAAGMPLRGPAERRYDVGSDERGHVDPGAWAVTAPSDHTQEPLEVTFDRRLDHGLVGRCLHVVGPDGRRVEGTQTIGPEERSWRFVPRASWAPDDHQLVIDPLLEDLAGNSVSRVFDRDLTRAEERPRHARPVAVSFRPRPAPAAAT